MKLRAVIADDEPLARERLRLFLAEETDIQVVAECADGVATLEAVEQLQPELLFLDVQMPRLTGFEVLEALSQPAPVVIFTTAYDQHAIRAFEVNAVDYLLKPFKQARFRKALLRARSLLQTAEAPGADAQRAALQQHLRQTEPQARIIVRSPSRVLFLKPQEVDYVSADGNYVRLQVGKESHMIRETMNAMEARLAPAGFMRISRSVLVNLNRFRELKPLGASEFCVILQDGTRFDMSCPLRELQQRLAAV